MQNQVHFSCLSCAAVLERLEQQGRSEQIRICFCEANLYSNIQRDPAVAQAVRSADLVLPDGIAVYALCRLNGQHPKERISGPRFMLEACEYGLSRGWRHFFYGSEPGVADQLKANLEKQFPGIQIVGTYSPPFRPLTPEELQNVKARIEATRPDLLWVSLGSPKQELWIANEGATINVPVKLAVGAAFDFHSGHRPWAPAWVRRIGMEWLFRMVTGGRKTLRRNLRCVSSMAIILLKTAVFRVFHRGASG